MGVYCLESIYIKFTLLECFKRYFIVVIIIIIIILLSLLHVARYNLLSLSQGRVVSLSAAGANKQRYSPSPSQSCCRFHHNR